MFKRIFWKHEYQALIIELDGDITIEDCQQAMQESRHLQLCTCTQQPVHLVVHLLEQANITDELNHIHVIVRCLQTNLDLNNLGCLVIAGKLDIRFPFHTILATAMELLGIKYQIVPTYNQAIEVLCV